MCKSLNDKSLTLEERVFMYMVFKEELGSVPIATAREMSKCIVECATKETQDRADEIIRWVENHEMNNKHPFYGELIGKLRRLTKE